MADSNQIIQEESNQNKPASDGVIAHRNEEGAAIQAREQRRKQRIERCLCLVGLIVFKIIVITILAVTVFNVRSPKMRINSAAVISGSITTIPSPAFTMTLNIQVLMKNKNLGRFKFDSGSMILTYRGLKVGEAQIPSGKVKMRGIWWMNICIDVNSNLLGNHPNLSSDLNSGLLVLNAKAKVMGKVSVMKIFKRRKSGKMNCNITIRVANKVIHNVYCK